MIWHRNRAAGQPTSPGARAAGGQTSPEVVRSGVRVAARRGLSAVCWPAATAFERPHLRILTRVKNHHKAIATQAPTKAMGVRCGAEPFAPQNTPNKTWQRPPTAAVSQLTSPRHKSAPPSRPPGAPPAKRTTQRPAVRGWTAHPIRPRGRARPCRGASSVREHR